MSTGPIRVLLIEDNPEDARLMEQAFAKAKEGDTVFELTHADRLATGLQRLAQGGVDLILLDLTLPDSKELDTLVMVRAKAPRVPIVVLTASDDETLALRALQRGAQDYLVKGTVQVYRTLLGRSMRYAIERKRAEEEVRAAHAQTEQLLFSIPSILIGLDEAGLVTHWNVVAEATFGIPAAQVITRPFAECGIRCETAKILERLADCRSTNELASFDDMPFTRADGQQGYLGVTIIPMRGDASEDAGFLLFGADVTERNRAEEERFRLQEQLLQSQKMETIGRFAGGIAHDFNNFLQVILGFAWLIRARAQESPELFDDLQEIIHAVESASGMVRQLLVFSRRQPLQLKALEINQTIQSMERLLQQLVGDTIRVDLQLASIPLVVTLDPTWVEQIMMNLCANARDSMQQGGTLTITTHGVDVDDAFLQTRPWWTKKGRYVQLSIQDTGIGMDPAVAAHVFEPFFTTKQLGKGTGLGLAVVYGLVKQHEGVIDIETAVGHGTTFHLYFPSQDVQPDTPISAPDAPQASRAAEDPAVDERRGLREGNGRANGHHKPRVLVVDDNPPIRVLCERILQEVCEVTVVSSGREALEALGKESYDLLLTDLRMPNMDGVDLLKEVSKLNAVPRMMAMTGSITDEMQRRLKAVSLSTDILRKPFGAPALLALVNRCLSQPKR